MVWLAVDASTSRVAGSLVDGDATLATSVLPAPPRRSEVLFDVVLPLLASQSLSFRDLSGIAVGIGPGSYTGLRVSLVAARAWALPLRLPVRAYPSPASLAFRFFSQNPSESSAFFAGHARRGFRWTARFSRSAPSSPIPAPDPVFALLPDALPFDAPPSMPPDTPPDPAALARLAILDAPSAPLAPLYLQPPVNTPPRFAPDGSPLN